MLEFHDGSVEDIAAQAIKLATKASLESSHFLWTSIDSRVTTLTSPIGLSSELGNWTEIGIIAPYSAVRTTSDVDMADGGIGCV
jgi:hypothetical protein